MTSPKKGERFFGADLPSALLDMFQYVEHEYKPPFYKKHVIAAAMLAYMNLTPKERLEYCQDAMNKFFIPAQDNQSKQAGEIDEAKFQELLKEAENAGRKLAKQSKSSRKNKA